MPIKLNSYTLKDNTIDTMRNMIHDTKIDKLERQFDFCAQHNNILSDMNRCIGDQCSVISRKVCVEGKFTGTYHTHPSPFSEKPSSGDLLNIQSEGMGCVGSAKTNRIRCFIYKDGEKGYEYYKGAHEDLRKVDEMEKEIVGDAIKKPELWPKIAKQIDALKEKDRVIHKYFKTVRIS